MLGRACRACEGLLGRAFDGFGRGAGSLEISMTCGGRAGACFERGTMNFVLGTDGVLCEPAPVTSSSFLGLRGPGNGIGMRLFPAALLSIIQ